ncbi:MAG: MTAP family purine nucleoside phosphorylase, partial [Candidatus Staskawiczbacteria bacterium]|nr:MTAP family purine nucleoside phosphorylase [Candidatus Staskawiczbacteria bacterium]
MSIIGIIGGSGLEQTTAFKISEEKKVATPYGVEPVILKPPSQVNFRANVFALKEVGCDYVLATTAVGSLKEEIKRGDLVILDQFIDFTKHRFSTFYEKFEPHKPIHTAMADPFSEFLRKKIITACQKLSLSFHEKGTVVTIEGPRFSTRAESKMFKLWGADVINMSIAPEAVLCNEVSIPYAAIAMSTDYDCWKEDEAPVS